MALTAGLWIRVSTGGQDEQAQVPDLVRHCQANGYVIAEKRYELGGKSAFKGDQQEMLDEALRDATEGRIQVLVCWAADRLERRGLEELFKTLRLFREAGCRVDSVQDKMLGTEGLAGEMMTAFASLVAKYESARKSERIRLSFDTIDENGAWRGRIPFGYVTEGPKKHKQLVPTKEGKRLVKTVFEMIAGGKDSGADVAAWLAEQTGDKWWPKSVTDMIRRPVYMGYATSPDGSRTHKCEAIVGGELWQAANDRLDRPELPHRGPNGKSPAMLKGAAFCAVCGGSMLRMDGGNKHLDGTKSVLFYYRCYGIPGPHRRCTSNPAVMARLEWADAAVDEFMSGLDGVEITERKLVAGKNWKDEIKLVEWQLRELPRKGLDEDEEDAQRAALRAEKKRLLSLEIEPDVWEDVPTGKTYADVWNETPVAERGRWLDRHDISITIARNWLEVASVVNGVELWRSRRYSLAAPVVEQAAA